LKTTNVSLTRGTIVTCHVAVHFLNKKSQSNTCHNHKMTRVTTIRWHVAV